MQAACHQREEKWQKSGAEELLAIHDSYRRLGDHRYRGHAHLAGAVVVDRSCVCASSNGSLRKITKVTAASFLLIGSLIADLALMLKVEEDHSPAEYAAFTAVSTVSRVAKVGEIEELEGTMAYVSASSSATETAQVISSLHQSCDWLLQNCDLWKSARSGDIGALKNARAVLVGADCSSQDVSESTS